MNREPDAAAVVKSWSELPALAARGDEQILAILRDRAAGDLEPLFAHFIDDLLVGERALFIFLGDDFE
jgi:hypothetical protein